MLHFTLELRNLTRWHHIFSDELRKGIGDELKELVGGSAEFKAVFAEAKAYRDKHVAHQDVDDSRPKKYPNLGHMQITAHYLYRILHEDLAKTALEGGLPNPSRLAGPDLQRAEDAWAEIADAARAATRDFREP